MELSGARFVVVGLGSSGRAAVRVLRAHGADVVANDSRDREALDASLGGGRALDELEALGATLELGGHDAARLGQADGIVVSPGVPRLAVLDEAERAGVPVVSEVELASWFVQSTVIGVTGTNGKSTVTAWVGQMCEASGRPTFVGGNLGRPAVEVVDTDAARGDGLVVLELSSFQLERVDRFHANVAALLNVSDDHLDRYESFDAYAAAKGRIFERQGDDDAAVVPDGDARCAALARSGGGRLMTFGGAKGSVRVDGGQLVDAVSGLTVPLRALQPRGSHNVDNACASTLIARLAGVDAGAIADGLVSFKGLPHRMVRVRVIGSIAFYDDSKATNVAAAVAAVDGLTSGEDPIPGAVVLIAGGVDKGGSYAPLAERVAERARAVVTLGRAAPLIEAALGETPVPVERARDMGEAVRLALAAAQPGDAVLLAPACSSFDMFTSYAARGDAFVEAVRALPEPPGRGAAR